MGGHAGDTILPLLSQASPAFAFSEAEAAALTQRIQNGGTEVVEAKAGAGSATLSMAAAAQEFADACARAMLARTPLRPALLGWQAVCAACRPHIAAAGSPAARVGCHFLVGATWPRHPQGEPGVVGCAYVASHLTEAPFFASRLRLGRNGVEEMLPLGTPAAAHQPSRLAWACTNCLEAARFAVFSACWLSRLCTRQVR